MSLATPRSVLLVFVLAAWRELPWSYFGVDR